MIESTKMKHDNLPHVMSRKTRKTTKVTMKRWKQRNQRRATPTIAPSMPEKPKQRRRSGEIDVRFRLQYHLGVLPLGPPIQTLTNNRSHQQCVWDNMLFLRKKQKNMKFYINDNHPEKREKRNVQDAALVKIYPPANCITTIEAASTDDNAQDLRVSC